MLKSNSKDITFEQLMQQAAQVAKAQDSVLIEKAKERKRQEEERRQKEQAIQQEKQKKERALLAKHQEIEARHRQLLQQKQHPVRKPPRPAADTRARTIPSSTKATPRAKKKTAGVPLVPVFEKKKPVHMSYEQLMAKAKEVTTPNKKPTMSNPRKEIKPPTDNRKDMQVKPSTSVVKRPISTIKSKQPPEPDRIRSNPPVRPKRPTMEESDIRPRPRPPSQPPMRKQQQRPPIRMPFRRPMDPKRQQHQQRRPAYDDEEDDEDLDEFIVDDEDDDLAYAHHENDYSSEISKIFRYDRKRYANESVYSDDDMEANSMDVLREEKRSERLARREDQLEEQLELERQRKRQAKARAK